MNKTDDKKTIFGTSPFVVMEQEEADLIAEQKKKAIRYLNLLNLKQSHLKVDTVAWLMQYLVKLGL